MALLGPEPQVLEKGRILPGLQKKAAPKDRFLSPDPHPDGRGLESAGFMPW